MMADQTTTQSKYKKKKKPEQQPSIDPNEVRIKGNQGHVKRYVDYACSLLEGKRVPDKRRQQERQQEQPQPVEKSQPTEVTEDKDKDKPAGGDDKPSTETDDKDKTDTGDDKDKTDDTKEDEKGDVEAPAPPPPVEKKPDPSQQLKFDTIVLKATGRAINKAVTTAEVVKRRICGLHQVTSLETLEITDVWEPLEQGLKEVETKRRVASITITLSRDEEAISKDASGYQQPISSDAIKPFSNQNRNRRGGGYRSGGYRSRGRGYNNYYNNYNRRGGGYNNYNRRGGGGYRGGYNRRGGYNNYNRSPNRSPRGGGYNRRGRGRGRGRGGYNRNRGGYGGYDNRRRY